MASKAVPMEDPALRSLPPSPGFLLLDSGMNPIVVNRAAVEILSYPEKPESTKRFNNSLVAKIRSILLPRLPSNGSPLVAEFRSGKRLYFCRAFPVEARTKEHEQATIAVFLEREVGSKSLSVLRAASERFHLTGREQEVLQFLLDGLTSKEIADRMKISPNTVKAFLRLIMVKMGVSTRSGIVGKAMTSASIGH
jgi:DNA-binding CsgD family transcriptional regulator